MIGLCRNRFPTTVYAHELTVADAAVLDLFSESFTHGNSDLEGDQQSLCNPLCRHSWIINFMQDSRVRW